VTAPVPGGPVVVDLRALQTPDTQDSAVVGYCYDFVNAIERHRPDLVCRYLLAPDAPPPGDLGDLSASGKLTYGGTDAAIPECARVYHSLSVLDLEATTTAIWPAVVEHLGLAYSASVHELIQPRDAGELLADPLLRRRYMARCSVLRLADALLAVSPATRRDLIELVDVDPTVITVVGGAPPWQEVVERSAEVFERLARRPRRPWRKETRVALVSPFPPIVSGVARYSSHLAPALAAELAAVRPEATLDCFADGLDQLPAGAAQARGRGDSYDARHLIDIELAHGGYERVIYVLGNSQFHSAALASLRLRSGIVMAHDVRLTQLLRLSAHVYGAVPGGLEGAIRRAYGDAVPEGVGRDDTISDTEIERYGVLLMRDIAPYADRVLVSSQAALALAAADVGAEYSGRLGVLPFAMALDTDELAVVAAARQQRGRDDRPLVASFGIVDPIKLPYLLLEAFASVHGGSDAELAFIGPISEALSDRVSEHASKLGIGERVRITGHLQRSAYLDYLGRTTVAVQLRAGFSGEASAAVGDCLAAGVPTIVSNIGWMADLPDDVVVKIDPSAASSGVVELGRELAGFFDDPEWRAGLSERAAAYAAEQTFARTATALVTALGLAEQLTPLGGRFRAARPRQGARGVPPDA